MNKGFSGSGRRIQGHSQDLWEPGKPRRSSHLHAGFRLGLIGGVVMVAVHIFMLLVFQATNQGDVLAWMIGWFVYFFIGRAAGAAQYREAMRRDYGDPIREVKAAGRGAALITSVIVWFFVVLRGILRDAVGITILVDPVGLCVAMFVDICLSMVLGTWGAKGVEKKYRVHVDF